MARQANPELPGKILEAAEQIVVRGGHEALNMRDLARRVGVTATAIYHYFSGKAELLLQLKLRAVERLNRRIRSLPQGLDPMERLHALGRQYLAFAQENPNLYRLVFEAPVGGTALAESEQSVLYFTYRVARRALEELAESGSYPLDPRYGAMMGWVMLHGFSSLLMSGNLEPAEGMDGEELRELFLRLYSGGPGKPTGDR